MITTSMRLYFGEEPTNLQAEVPLGPIPAQEALPAIRQLTDQLVAIGIEESARQGKPVTCAKGCSACCHRHISVTQLEARRLYQVIEEMPEPRRTEVRARFAGAVDALSTSDLFQGPCPFLEDNACSIYDERPLACREYLVTSPPANCSNASGAGVERLPLLARPADALTLAMSDPESDRPAALPLIRLREWVEQNPDDTRKPELGPEWVNAFCEKLITEASNA